MEEVICATKQEHEVIFRHNSNGPATSPFTSKQDTASQRNASGLPSILFIPVNIQNSKRAFHSDLGDILSHPVHWRFDIKLTPIKYLSICSWAQNVILSQACRWRWLSLLDCSLIFLLPTVLTFPPKPIWDIFRCLLSLRHAQWQWFLNLRNHRNQQEELRNPHKKPTTLYNA